MEENLFNYINYYIDYCLMIKNLSIATINSYQSSIKYFFIYYNQVILNNKYENYLNIEINNIKNLKEKDFYNYICYLIIKNSNIRTRIRKIQCLKLFFDYLYHTKHIIDSNPIASIAKERTRLKITTKPLLKSDTIKLLNYKCYTFIDIRNKAILSLFINCGLRNGELRELKISDFNFKEDKFLVLGKGNKERFCYLNKTAKKDLNVYLKYRQKLVKYLFNKDVLFFNNNYKKMSSSDILSIIKHMYKINKIDYTKYNVHSLRHTFATNLYKANVHINVIREALGHSCIEATQFYLHPDDTDMRNNIANHPLANIKNINKRVIKRGKIEKMKNINLILNNKQANEILYLLKTQIYITESINSNSEDLGNRKEFLRFFYAYVQSSILASEDEEEGSVKFNSTEKRILELLENNNSLTQIQIAKILNLSENCIYKNLRKLKEKGEIFRVGANKNGYWSLRNKIRDKL